MPVYIAFAYTGGESSAPQSPYRQHRPYRQRHTSQQRPGHEMDAERRARRNRWMRRAPELVGIGVVLAALIVLLWPSSLITLGLGALAIALFLLLGIGVALLVAHRRTR
jgi:hypothetical protein